MPPLPADVERIVSRLTIAVESTTLPDPRVYRTRWKGRVSLAVQWDFGARSVVIRLRGNRVKVQSFDGVGTFLWPTPCRELVTEQLRRALQWGLGDQPLYPWPPTGDDTDGCEHA